MEIGVTVVQVIPPYGLRLEFEDGTAGTVDFRDWIMSHQTGLVAELRDPDCFARVFVNQEFGHLEWPNGVDVCPDLLYEEAHRPSSWPSVER